jgi:hypothetical protein
MEPVLETPDATIGFSSVKFSIFYILGSAPHETSHSPWYRCTIELGGGGVYLTYEQFSCHIVEH